MRTFLLTLLLVFCTTNTLSAEAGRVFRIEVSPRVAFEPARVKLIVWHTPDKLDRIRDIGFYCEGFRVDGSRNESLQGERERYTQQFFFTLRGCYAPIQVIVTFVRADSTQETRETELQVRSRTGEYQ